MVKTLPDGLLEKMTSALVEELDPEAIYLFGSHAWGDPDEDSDVDLMVIVEEDDVRERFEKSVRGMTALRGLVVAKDVVTRNKQAFEKRRLQRGTLEYDVAVRGRQLYAR